MNRTIIAISIALCTITAGRAFAADAVCGGDKPVKVAVCKDGKVMCSATNEHRGACSGHGGVASWGDGSEVKSHAKKNEYK
jgi:hypothetical protein